MQVNEYEINLVLFILNTRIYEGHQKSSRNVLMKL